MKLRKKTFTQQLAEPREQGQVTFNRRVLLRGAAVGSGAAMLVTLSNSESANAGTIKRDGIETSQDSLCYFGLNVPEGTNFLSIYTSQGSQSFAFSPLDAHLVRTANQEQVIGVTPVTTSGPPSVRLTSINVDTGIAKTCQGALLPVPSDTSYIFSLAVNKAATQAAVLHQPAWMSATETITKTAGKQSLELNVGPWSGARYLELFDLTTMSSKALIEIDKEVSSAPLGSIGYTDDNTIFVFTRDRDTGDVPATTFRSRLFQDGSQIAECPIPQALAISSIYEGFPYVAISSSVLAQQSVELNLSYLNLVSGEVTFELPLLNQMESDHSAKGLPSRLIDLDDGRLVFVRAERGADVIDLRSQTIVASAEIAAGTATSDGTPPLRAFFAAVDMSRSRLFVADARPNQGGVWVYDLQDLSLIDRWLSSTRLEGLYCGPTGSLFVTPLGTNLNLVLDSMGNVQSTIERSGYPVGIIA